MPVKARGSFQTEANLRINEHNTRVHCFWHEDMFPCLPTLCSGSHYWLSEQNVETDPLVADESYQRSWPSPKIIILEMSKQDLSRNTPHHHLTHNDIGQKLNNTRGLRRHWDSNNRKWFGLGMKIGTEIQIRKVVVRAGKGCMRTRLSQEKRKSQYQWGKKKERRWMKFSHSCL